MSDIKEEEITYTNNISVEAYNGLRKSVGWIQLAKKRAAIALGNSFYLCVAMSGDEPIGMASPTKGEGSTRGRSPSSVSPKALHTWAMTAAAR